MLHLKHAMEDRPAKQLVGFDHTVAGLLAGQYYARLTVVPDTIIRSGAVPTG
jgi:hypothetical protein